MQFAFSEESVQYQCTYSAWKVYFNQMKGKKLLKVCPKKCAAKVLKLSGKRLLNACPAFIQHASELLVITDGLAVNQIPAE